MADEPEFPHDDAEEQWDYSEEQWDDAEEQPGLAGRVLQPKSTAEVAVRSQPRIEVWRNRALALRDALPQIARNPVVAGASAAAATVVLRVAVDAVARRALGTPAPTPPMALDVTGHVVHHVHVFHHVRVVHHFIHEPGDYVALRVLRPPTHR